jgi:hypothetical protein
MFVLTNLQLIIKTYLGLRFYVSETEFEITGINCDEDVINSFQIKNNKINKYYNNVSFNYVLSHADIPNVFVTLN